MKAHEYAAVNKNEIKDELVKKAKNYKQGCRIIGEQPGLSGFIDWIGYEEWMDALIAEELNKIGMGDTELDGYEYDESECKLIDELIKRAWTESEQKENTL